MLSWDETFYICIGERCRWRQVLYTLEEVWTWLWVAENNLYDKIYNMQRATKTELKKKNNNKNLPFQTIILEMLEFRSVQEEPAVEMTAFWEDSKCTFTDSVISATSWHYKAIYTYMRVCEKEGGLFPLPVWVRRLELLSHLQQRVNGCILVSPLCVQHRADHFLVKVGEHVLQSLQVLFTAHGLLGSSGGHAGRHGHGHHALVIDRRNS